MLTQEKSASENHTPVLAQQNRQPGEVTRLLLKWKNGETDAFDELVAIVNGELRRRAHQYLRREHEGNLIQTTALVDDVWMRLGGGNEVDWQDRAHFYAIAAQEMRRILVDEARKRNSQKRGGGWTRVSLTEPLVITVELDLDLVALDEALTWLKHYSLRQYQVVLLRFFGGLTIEEVAVVLNVSGDTVKSDWDRAQRWLFRQLNGEESGHGTGTI